MRCKRTRNGAAIVSTPIASPIANGAIVNLSPTAIPHQTGGAEPPRVGRDSVDANDQQRDPSTNNVIVMSLLELPTRP
jgi:hypothetical protein